MAQRTYEQPVLELSASATPRREWLRSLWEHREVIWVLARQDFQVRYKRATLGILWAVAVPVVQAAVMILVFSHFIHTRGHVPYGAFVLSGILAWSYFSTALPFGVTAIVDGTDLSDKVWFPRAVLPLVPCMSGLVGLAISMVILIIGATVLGAHIQLTLLLLVPACALLVAFTVALTMVLAALQVYFRDVRFIVAAALLVWIYATPILYPESTIKSFGKWLDFNPFTGVVTLFHLAVFGDQGDWVRPLVVALAVTFALTVAVIETHRRHDRLFVDLL